MQRWCCLLNPRTRISCLHLLCSLVVLSALLQNLRVSQTAIFFQSQKGQQHLSSSSSSIALVNLVKAKASVTPAAFSSSLKYYVLDVPELTDWLVGNHTEESFQFYSSTLNEDQGEIWLHKGFVAVANNDNLTIAEAITSSSRTFNQSEADVILIPAYLHLLRKIRALVKDKKIEAKMAMYPNPDQLSELVVTRVLALAMDSKKTTTITTKPHVLLVPTTNPETSRKIGIAKLVAALQRNNVNLYSLGYERNTYWQHVSPNRILPIPYVVQNPTSMPFPSSRSAEAAAVATSRRKKETRLFYVSDSRKHAFAWSGCNRSMVIPLSSVADMDVHLVDHAHDDTRRLSQEDYNRRMSNSMYCLLLCGDTPTSRSLTSAVFNGCIPIRVGSRLRGLCDPPCRSSWGWTVTNGLSHLPFNDDHHSYEDTTEQSIGGGGGGGGGVILWSRFPEVNESSFASDPISVMNDFFSSVTEEDASAWRAQLENARLSFIYGWGSPVNSTQLGGAVLQIWSSLHRLLVQSGELQ